MARFNQERQKQIEPKRIDFARKEIENLGFEIINEDSTKIQFNFKGNTISIFPYSGWFSGKGIKDGRGLKQLLKQIEENK